MAAKQTNAKGADAFSYIRFSSPKQAEGDSLRRQAADAKAWCDRNGAVLNTTRTLHDLGKSAFKGNHRANPDRNALAAFLKLVEEGKIARGSYLIVESLDRLTREHIRPALTLLLNLIDNGVRVVQLKPVEVVYDEDVEPMTLMMALMELSRGNSESKVKSQRVGAAWENRRTYVREARLKVLHHNLPAWVEERKGKLMAVASKALVIKKIYTLAAQGLGANRIAEKLVADKTPPFLAVVNGKGAKGKRGGKWRRSYVALLLADRRVVGELQMKSKSRKAGEPIKDYFPQVITEDEWQRARAASKLRRKSNGRGNGGSYDKPDFVNVFAGLVWDGIGHTAYHSSFRYEGIRPGARGRPHYVLRNQDSVEGRSVNLSFPLDTFEHCVLSALREVDPAQVMDDAEQPDDVLAIAAELERTVGQLNKIKDEVLTGGDVAMLADAARQLEAKQLELKEREQEARERKAVPLDAAWQQYRQEFCIPNDPNPMVQRNTGDKLAEVAKDSDKRLLLRALLRRMIKGIWIVCTNRGKDRLCSAQIWFDGEKTFREVRVMHRPPVRSPFGNRDGRWWYETRAFKATPRVIDLRTREGGEQELRSSGAWHPELEEPSSAIRTGVIPATESK